MMGAEENNRSGEWGFQKIIQVTDVDGMRIVWVKGQRYMSWQKGDEGSERLAMVQLYELGVGTQRELADAFGVHVNTVSHYVTVYGSDGSEGLLSEPRGPKESWKIAAEVRGKILWIVYREGIREYEGIQKRYEEQWGQRIGVASIRQVLIENGFVQEKVKTDFFEQSDLFKRESCEELALEFRGAEATVPRVVGQRLEVVGGPSRDVEGTKNRSDYGRAERNYLDGLERGMYSAYGGGFLVAPLLERYHFLERTKEVVRLETHEGYRLEQLCLTLFYFDLFDFRSIENFKTAYAEEFGVLIGRGVSPSIYTLRRWMHRVRKLKKGDELIAAFGKEYLKSGLVGWGVLYIDSHFHPYYGIRVITKGWHGVQDKAMKGSYQFLGIDEEFNPLMFLVRPSSDDLLEMIPPMIETVRRWARELGMGGDDLTVIFDREGYSAELFRTLNAMKPKVKFMTWAKYMDRWVGDYKDEEFKERMTVHYEVEKEQEIRYLETKRAMNKYGPIRTLVIEGARKDHRSAIYTNDDVSESSTIIQRMCRRWGQETLNKTFKWDHKMDYHPGYVSEELDEQPMVDNPKRKELKEQKAALLSKLSALRTAFAEKALDATSDEAHWREVKEQNKEVFSEINRLRAQITLLEQEIDKFPKEVRFDEAHGGKELVELDYEKKRFLDCIKMYTYHMEKQMCAQMAPHYDNPKEVYSVLAMILRRGADLKLERGQLRVQLKSFRNAEVGYVARHLCEDLNQMQPRTLDKFRFKLRFEVA